MSPDSMEKAPSMTPVPMEKEFTDEAFVVAESTSNSPSVSVVPSTSTQPSISTEPSVSTQPSVSAQPSVSTHPSVSTEPSVSTQPSVSSSPSAEACHVGTYTFGDGSGLKIKDFLVVPDTDPGTSTCNTLAVLPKQSAVNGKLPMALHAEYTSAPDTCYTATITNINCGDKTLFVAMYDYDTKTYDREINLYGTSGFLAAGATVTFDFATTASSTDETATGGTVITPYVGESYYGAQPTACQYSIRVVHKETGACVDYVEY